MTITILHLLISFFLIWLYIRILNLIPDRFSFRIWNVWKFTLAAAFVALNILKLLNRGRCVIFISELINVWGSKLIFSSMKTDRWLLFWLFQKFQFPFRLFPLINNLKILIKFFINFLRRRLMLWLFSQNYNLIYNKRNPNFPFSSWGSIYIILLLFSILIRCAIAICMLLKNVTRCCIFCWMFFFLIRFFYI